MIIDIDKPDRQKAYWLSINGKFFKKKLNTHVELAHVSSVKALQTYSQNITLYSEENHYLSNLYENRYDSYTEITKEEYDETIQKFKDFVEKFKTLFSEI